MGVFDEILQKVSEEDRAVLNKYPDLKATVETLEQEYGKLAQYANQWTNWADNNWDSEAGMTRAEKELRDEIERLSAEIEAAKSPGSTTSNADLTELRKEFDQKISQLQAESSRTVEGLHRFYQSYARHLLPHQQEFGENLDPAKFLEFMESHRGEAWASNPDLAYDQMVAERRRQLAEKREQERLEQHQKEIEEARADERKKVMQEVSMGPQGVLPTDSTGGIAGVTSPINNKPAELSEELKSKLADAKLGDGSLPTIGFELYRRGELRGTQ